MSKYYRYTMSKGLLISVREISRWSYLVSRLKDKLRAFIFDC